MRRQRLGSDVRGAVYVEYVALLTMVTLLAAAAVVALGVPLLRLFRFAEIVLASPLPGWRRPWTPPPPSPPPPRCSPIPAV
jgi:hypothetical protein